MIRILDCFGWLPMSAYLLLELLNSSSVMVSRLYQDSCPSWFLRLTGANQSLNQHRKEPDWNETLTVPWLCVGVAHTHQLSSLKNRKMFVWRTYCLACIAKPTQSIVQLLWSRKANHGAGLIHVYGFSSNRIPSTSNKPDKDASLTAQQTGKCI